VTRTGINYEGRDPRFAAAVLPLAEVVEVTPDAIATLRDGRVVIPEETLRELRAIARRTPVTLHGVGLSIASADAMNESYLALVDELMLNVDVAWHSEHLGYTTIDGENLGTMLVPPRTVEALELICERVESIQRRYAKAFLLEHVVNLFPDPGGDSSAAGFLNEIVRRTGCGLILDVYNLECDVHNGLCNAEEFLEELELAAVREIHIANGTIDRGLRVDVHSRVTRDETLAMLRDVLPRTPNVEAVIFEMLGPYVGPTGVEAVAAELERVRRAAVSAAVGERPARRPMATGRDARSLRARTPALLEHQRAMRDLIQRGAVADDPYIEQASRAIGLAVTRDTTRGWRVFRLGQNCRFTTAMLRARGRHGEVLAAIDSVTSPFIEELSRAFLDAAIALGDALIASVARLERSMLSDEETVVDWPCDPYEVLGPLLRGELPPELPYMRYKTVVSRAMPGRFRVLTEES